MRVSVDIPLESIDLEGYVSKEDLNRYMLEYTKSVSPVLAPLDSDTRQVVIKELGEVFRCIHTDFELPWFADAYEVNLETNVRRYERWMKS